MTSVTRCSASRAPSPGTSTSIQVGAKSCVPCYGCDQCDKMFSKQSSLARHKYEHSGRCQELCPLCPLYKLCPFLHGCVGLYGCDQCDKMFSKQSSLARHKYEHSGRCQELCPLITYELCTLYKLCPLLFGCINFMDMISVTRCLASSSLARHKYEHSGRCQALCPLIMYELCPLHKLCPLYGCIS